MLVFEGDIFEYAKNGKIDVLVHGCNCFCKMESGIALQVKYLFPNAYKVDQKTKMGNKSKLGTITYVEERIGRHNIYVVNAYTQYNYSKYYRCVKYDAVRSCFQKVKAKFTGLRIGYPLIGCGLGGGDWNIISDIIKEELKGEYHGLVHFKPKKAS